MNGNGLQIQDLSFSYPSWNNSAVKNVFSGLDLSIAPGELAVIFGGAESGKSTLALIIAALIPLHTGGKLSGELRYNDVNIPETDASELIETCGIIFQDPEKQTVTTECFSEAAFALESLGVSPEEIDARVGRAFSRLNISSLLDAPVHRTSGGEKKKLALAGLLSVSPELWILDETFEELDNPSRIELIRLLRESGKTVLIFSSKFFKAFSEADAFFLLKEGAVSPKEGYPFGRDFRKALADEGVIPDFSSNRSVSEKSRSAQGRGQVLLSAENLAYRYGDGGFQLDVGHFSLAENETVSIVGRNGCGKSTLARILCGLTEPQSGSVSAHDTGLDATVQTADSAYLNSFCAYMFQNPDYQIFLPSVYEELAYGLKEAGYSHSVMKAMTGETIAAFRLPAGSTPPAMMSFSARKRLQAAVYYLLKRPVFILDEADTGLSFRDFIDLIGRLKKTCRGLIIITHNLELASAVSDRVLGMSGGRLYDNILDFSPEKLNEWLTEAGESDGAEE